MYNFITIIKLGTFFRLLTNLSCKIIEIYFIYLTHITHLTYTSTIFEKKIDIVYESFILISMVNGFDRICINHILLRILKICIVFKYTCTFLIEKYFFLKM